ncbi:MAG: ribonuclease H family protein, partial [Lachnospiraceae bacterium]|nr:ribonuclease H family protein [Lachnospiraceae bacterium]
MAKTKFYAVKNGRVPGIYSTWRECEEQIKGFSGAIYKSFATLEEAESFMSDSGNKKRNPNNGILTEGPISTEDFNLMVNDRIASLKEDEVIAFVDGSYNVEEEKSAFGAIIICSGGNRNMLYKAFTKNLGEDFIALRNVAAELEGVKEAVNWSITYKMKKLTVYYDYEGIEKWATGAWKAKKELTKNYVAFIQEKMQKIDIEFIKVLAHSGIELNEEVDALAKNALLAKGYKTYEDGSVYFVGYGLEDWKSVVDSVNE